MNAAATAMKRVLVDHAKHKKAKRKSGVVLDRTVEFAHTQFDAGEWSKALASLGNVADSTREFQQVLARREPVRALPLTGCISTKCLLRRSKG